MPNRTLKLCGGKVSETTRHNSVLGRMSECSSLSLLSALTEYIFLPFNVSFDVLAGLCRVALVI